MNIKSRVIFGDMSTVREYGIESLEENYFWPVSGVEFEDFIKCMHNTYVELTLKIEDEHLYDIALIELSFVANLMQIFHYNYVKEYAKINNIKLLTAADSESDNNPDWTALGGFYSNIEFPYGKIRRLFRRLVKNIYFNKHLPIVKIIKGLFCKNNVISIGSKNFCKHEFIHNRDKFFSHYDWIDLLNTEGESIDKNVFFKENIITPFLSTIKSSGNFFVKNVDFLEIEKAWSQRFYDLSALYFGLINNKSKIKTLLVSDMSKVPVKVITMAYQRKKTDVYCFHHGNDACYSVGHIGFEKSIAHCKKFVTPTNGIRDKYKEAYANSLIVKKQKPEYISINSNYYTELFSKYSLHNNVPIKKIMLIGFPLNSIRYPYENNLFFYKMVSLEFRLIIALKKAGYYLIYKAHPDRLHEVRGVFNDYVDEYISQPFEAVWQKADLLLFTYTSTSTFGYALTTNLPIILVDSAKKYRKPDDYKLMQSRVNILNAKEDTHMKIQFNEKSLINMISNENVYKNFDFSYVDQIFGKQ